MAHQIESWESRQKIVWRGYFLLLTNYFIAIFIKNHNRNIFYFEIPLGSFLRLLLYFILCKLLTQFFHCISMWHTWSSMKLVIIFDKSSESIGLSGRRLHSSCMMWHIFPRFFVLKCARYVYHIYKFLSWVALPSKRAHLIIMSSLFLSKFLVLSAGICIKTIFQWW